MAALTALAKDGNGEFRLATAVALGSLGPKNDGVVKTLITLLAAEVGAPIRVAAADSLASFGRAGAPAAAAMVNMGRLHDGPPEGSPRAGQEALVAAMDRLQRVLPLPKDQIEPVTKYLSDGDVWVRQLAAVALSSSGADAAKALPALATMSQQDADGFVRQYAMRAMVGISPKAKETIAALGAVAAGPSQPADVRQMACQLLRTNAAGAKDAVPSLTTAAADASAHIFVRRDAVMALAACGADAASALPTLDALAKDTGDVRLSGPAGEAAKKIREAVAATQPAAKP
jgi:hypothetical protein